MASVLWQVVLDPVAQIMCVVRAAAPNRVGRVWPFENFSRSWQLSFGCRDCCFNRLRWKHSYEMKESIGGVFDANHFCFILL